MRRTTAVWVWWLCLAACDDGGGASAGRDAAAPGADATTDAAAPDAATDAAAPGADAATDAAPGPDAARPPGCTPAADPGPDVPTRREGRFVRTDAFPSAFLGRPRGLTVYLPAAYDADPQAEFAVLYLHDGQNLFFDEEAAFGRSWHVAETLDALVDAGRVPPLILVGVHNTAARIAEYTPSEDPAHPGSGRAGDYARFLAEELDPWVRFRFRTRCGPASTGVMGSSLGGLVSLDLLRRRPDVFGRAGALSPSLWWNGGEAQGWAPALGDAVAAGARVWVDAGGAEGDALDDGRTSVIGDARALVEALPAGAGVGYLEDPPAFHDEPAWAGRLAHALLHLYGAPSPAVALVPRTFGWPLRRVTAFSVDRWGADGRVRTLRLDEYEASAGELANVDGLLLRPVAAGATALSVRAGGLEAALPLVVAEEVGHPVLFVARAPAGTDAVTLTGSDASFGPWDPAAMPLAPTPGGAFAGTASLPPGARFEYKYTRGSWETVEKAADGSEPANRVFEVREARGRAEDVIPRWRDR